MMLIAHFFPNPKVHYGLQVLGQQTGARLNGHLKDARDRFELTYSRLLAITTYYTSSNYSMPREAPTTFEASRIEWPTF